MILAGDIGGTKTLVALYEDSSGPLSPVQEASYPSSDFPSLEAILRVFLDRAPHGALQAACFAVAGPVIDGKCQITNLVWKLDTAQLAEALHTRVRLVNDLEGAAHGLLCLGLRPATRRPVGRLVLRWRCNPCGSDRRGGQGRAPPSIHRQRSERSGSASRRVSTRRHARIQGLRRPG